MRKSGFIFRYRVRNWPAYTKALIQRRSITIWVPVLYRLLLRDQRRLAYDVIVEGVSLVSNYRSSSGAIARKSGMGGLIDALGKKVNAMS